MNGTDIEQFNNKVKMFSDLVPNERLILNCLEKTYLQSGKCIFSISDISRITCIARQHVFYYVKSLAEKDYIDMLDFGNMKQIILKEKKK